jgi:hypothetical protein
MFNIVLVCIIQWVWVSVWKNGDLKIGHWDLVEITEPRFIAPQHYAHEFILSRLHLIS